MGYGSKDGSVQVRGEKGRLEGMGGLRGPEREVSHSRAPSLSFY